MHRGIDTISAVGLVAEVGDFTRFKAAKNFASYTTYVPAVIQAVCLPEERV
jgi:transposase